MTKPSPSGRPVPIMMRTTEAGRDVIDELRGADSRAEFLRQATAHYAAHLRRTQRQGAP